MRWRTLTDQIKPNPKVPEMNPGDTVKVASQVKEGDRTRTQVFQGVVVKMKGTGPGAAFTVRKVSYGVGVERTYLRHSPLLESVEVVRRGSVRRAKLNYLRGLSAREARIKEKGRVGALAAALGVAEDTSPAATPTPATTPVEPAPPAAETAPAAPAKATPAAAEPASR